MRCMMFYVLSTSIWFLWRSSWLLTFEHRCAWDVSRFLTQFVCRNAFRSLLRDMVLRLYMCLFLFWVQIQSVDFQSWRSSGVSDCIERPPLHMMLHGERFWLLSFNKSSASSQVFWLLNAPHSVSPVRLCKSRLDRKPQRPPLARARGGRRRGGMQGCYNLLHVPRTEHSFCPLHCGGR